ncbi:MAG: tetratricopeptide repeat protein [Verrucomicrobia bacterium]|nr:tetratricopeptide repeat protein [Verrucomicrobiota bacterium]
MSSHRPPLAAFVARLLALALASGGLGAQTPTPPLSELESRLAAAADPRQRLGTLLALLEQRGKLKSEQALTHASSAEDLARQLGDRGALLKVLQAKGSVLFSLNRTAESLTARQEALELARSLGQEAEVLTALVWIGRLHFTRGDYPEAERPYTEALALARKTKDHTRELQMLNSLGNLADARGDYAGAVRFLQEAIDVAQQRQDPEGVVSARINLGTTLRHQDRHREALDQYRLAEAVASKSDHLVVAVLWNNTGDALSALGEHEPALAAQARSMEAAKAIPSAEIVAAVHESIGVTRRAMGQLDQAIAEFHEALSIYRSLNFRQGIVKTLNSLGAVQLERGELAGAIAYAGEALALAEQMQRTDGVRAAADTLMRAHRRLGRPTEALDYADKLAAANETLRGVETRKRIAELEARFRTAQKEREIERLNAQSEVQQLQIARQERDRQELVVGLIALTFGLLLLWNRYRVKQRAEEALRRQNEELAVERARADAANHAKSEFLANMSHEIRTPMNSILGFSELLEGRVEDDEQREYLEAISSSGKTLLRLINDILDLSKIEAGKLELQPTPTDLSTLLMEVRQMFSLQAMKKGLSVELALAADLPAELMLDEVRLRQIVVNTVGNALKFTESGGVVIRAAVRDEAAAETKTLVLEVVDTGVGIPEAEQQRVFEAFSQVAGQSAKRFGGTGLGLAITQRLVDMMGGRIALESEVGRGSTFRFEFPGLRASAEARPAWTPDEEAEIALERAFAALPALDFVVVDDVALNRRLVRDFLGPAHRVREAEDLTQALQLVRAERADLVISDLRMPGGSGLDLIRALRADPSLAALPVLILTASSQERDAEEMERLGVPFRRKPVSRLTLLGEVVRLVGGAEAGGPESGKVSSQG